MMEKYFGGYLQHPYMSLVHRPRLQVALHLLPVAPDHRRPQIPLHVRSPAWSRTCSMCKDNFPAVKEIFFDDDTLTDNHDRASKNWPRRWARWA